MREATTRPPEATRAPRLRRLFTRWWRRQSPARQDRLATLAPLASVLLFLAAIAIAYWTLRHEELAREIESVRRDAEITQQQIGLRLSENQEQLVRLAREFVTQEIDASAFGAQAAAIARDRHEIHHLTWLTQRRRVKATHRAATYPAESAAQTAPLTETLPDGRPEQEAERTFQAARDKRQPVYSRVMRTAQGEPVFQLHVPLIEQGEFAGVLIAEYSVQALLRQFVLPEISRRHRLSIVDDSDATVASMVTPMPGQTRERLTLAHDVPLTPVMNGFVIRSEGYRQSSGFIGNTLFWMVVALSLLTLWMLLGAWRHMRRRAQIQRALVQETQFRRAMENSLLTGMRALDMEGRITYVNNAFCQMSGFPESELVGRKPPFPYWPPDRIEENRRLLQQEMHGRSPAGGIEVRMMRKDGQMFDARMYMSPLVGANGQQAGWMTSVTNITEAKRIRDQLSASHERFTTVLEGLDASVSVLSVHQGDLLFANRSYRLWFGADARGHALLTGRPAGDDVSEDEVDELSGLPTQELTETAGDLREVFVEPLKKWFDVRSRYLQWTDGRLAQMVIATDVTARVRAEELAAQQAERAADASRLMTMGEMASSVAHELNQPLTAITNYCNGMVSRVESGSIVKADLVAALRKTAQQAERAGQVIHRIRAFVKKSEPQRQRAEAQAIVDNAVELAGIEVRRRQVAIRTYVAQRLPALMVDPILIEQVIMNLLKNAAEAIDAAQLPPSRRHVELRVVPRHSPEEGGFIEFSVTDAGPGIPEEVIARLYEAFFSTKPQGLGIGLSLCRSIIESHRGRLKAENLYNAGARVGCRFVFTLPVERPAQVETSVASPALGAAPSPSTAAIP